MSARPRQPSGATGDSSERVEGGSQPATFHLVAAQVHGGFHLRPAAGPPAGLLVGFHGYGESATANLDALARIPGSERWCLAAVEALHQFYDRKTGEVVRSWMTRWEREQAIRDNVAYVASAVAAARKEAGEPLLLVYAGFSQGTAMAWRAAARAGHTVDGLIILAGDLPPDLDASDAAPLPSVLLGRGRADSWYDEAKMERDLVRLAGWRIEVSTVVFDGGHEWGRPFLVACGELLNRIAEQHGGPER